MAAEAAFLAGYAFALVALAAGLGWVGRRSADPWSSPALVASRPMDSRQRDGSPPSWPHSEVPKFHHGLSAVALAAAALLTIANIVRHHRPVELVVELVLLVLIGVRLAYLGRALRQPD